MNRILAALVGAVVLLAVLAGVVVANRATPELNRDTPEGVVQSYLKAVFDEDYSKAIGLLSTSTRCDVSDVAASAPEPVQIVLDHSAVEGDHAVVTVDVTEGSGDDPFGPSGYSHKERVNVQRDGGVWKITSLWLLPPCDSVKG
jgi:hypothetical protein